MAAMCIAAARNEIEMNDALWMTQGVVGRPKAIIGQQG